MSVFFNPMYRLLLNLWRSGRGGHQRRTHRPQSRPLKLEQLESRNLLSGTWTGLTNPLGESGTMILLTDGTVMVQGGGVTNAWYKLTPDSSGSYINGTWSSLQSMNLQRDNYASNVLNDAHGSVLIVGGEDSGPQGVQNWTNTGEIYNPVANSWSPISQFHQSKFGDDPTMLLSNGSVLTGGGAYRPTDPGADYTWTYNPSTNQWTRILTANKLVRSGYDDSSDEESWVKLPDDSILTYDIWSSSATGTFYAERYIPSQNQWVDASNVNTTDPPKLLSSSSVGNELGAGLLLPDGRAFFLGGNGNTAFYSPSANQWSAGPALPTKNGQQLVAADAPAAVMPNGDVLMALSPIGTADSQGNNYTFPYPTYIYEFNSTNNTYTDVTPSPSIIDLSIQNGFGASYVDRMLVLPTGQILLNNGLSQLAVYTPGGIPTPEGKPTISSIYGNSDGSYTLTGTTLNGISAGASYGDDAEMDSNYPIIQLTKGSNVYYARTYNWNATGVGGNGATSTQFNLPSGLPAGTYTLSVIANGIASNPVEFTLWQPYQPIYSTASFSQISIGVAPNGSGPEVYGIGPDNNIYDSSDPSTPLVPNWQFKWIAAAPLYTGSTAEVFGLGEDNRIYYTTNNGSGWSPYQVYGDPNAHYLQISVGVAPGGSSPEVYGIGGDNNIYDATSNPFTPLVSNSQFKWIAAAPLYTGSTAEVFGLGEDNRIYVTTNTGSGWSPYQLYGDGNAHYYQISVGVAPGGDSPEVYGMGGDNNIYDASNSPFTPLVPDKQFNWIAAAPQYTTSGAQVFGLGLDNHIYTTTFPPFVGWSLYHLYGDPITHYNQISVGVAPNGSGPEVYGIGGDNNIWDASDPSAPLVPNSQFKWIAAAPLYTASGAEVFGLGEDNRIYYTTNNGSGWSPYQVYGDPNAHYLQISVGVAPGGSSPEVYGIGGDNNIYDATSNPFTPLVSNSQFKWIAAAPLYTGSTAEVFGLGEDNRIYVTTNTGSGWSPYQVYGDPNAYYLQISVGVAPGGSSPEVYGIGGDNNIWNASDLSAPLEAGTAFNWIAAAPQGSASGAEVFGLGLNNQIYVTTYHSSPPPSPPPPFVPSAPHSFAPASVQPAVPASLPCLLHPPVLEKRVGLLPIRSLSSALAIFSAMDTGQR